jgi:hypothetical protein
MSREVSANLTKESDRAQEEHMATSGMTTNLPHAVERIRPMTEVHATNAETN